MSINVQFPFSESTEGGVFGTNKTTQTAIRANLFAFLTMRRGQRPMNNKLYSPLYDFIFQPWDEISEDELREALVDKLSNFFPEISVEEIRMEFEEGENLLRLKIIYSINTLGGITDQVSVVVPVDEQSDHDHEH